MVTPEIWKPPMNTARLRRIGTDRVGQVGNLRRIGNPPSRIPNS